MLQSIFFRPFLFLHFCCPGKCCNMVGLRSGRVMIETKKGVLKSLRAFQNPFFTGEVVEENGICSAAFYESAALRAGIPLPSSPAAMPPSPRGRLLAVTVKFPAQLKGVPLGELTNVVSLRGYEWRNGITPTGPAERLSGRKPLPFSFLCLLS